MTQIQQIKHQKSVQYWQQIIQAQQESGLSARLYCEQQDLNYNAFGYWLRKIREEIAAALPIPENSPNTVQFAALPDSVSVAPETESVLKMSCGPAVLEISENTSEQQILRALRCIREVFQVC